MNEIFWYRGYICVEKNLYTSDYAMLCLYLYIAVSGFVFLVSDPKVLQNLGSNIDLESKKC